MAGSVEVLLMNGPGAPYPASLMACLESVNVDQQEQSPSTFQVTFTSDYTSNSYQDVTLQNSSQFGMGQRLIIAVVMSGTTYVLMDGVVTGVNYQPPSQTKEAQVTVTGEDLSYMMDIVDYSLEYPFSIDSAIAAVILAKYMAFGIIPEIVPTVANLLDIETVPQQMSTDREMLQSMANGANYIFSIIPTSVPGVSTAYWGPPKELSSIQRNIVVGSAGYGVVEDISFTFSGSSATRVWGMVDNKETDTPTPVIVPSNVMWLGYSSKPALTVSAPLTAKNKTFYHQGVDVTEAYANALAIVNQSVGQVVTGQGTIDGLAYGAALTAPGNVTVSGAGHNYDGLFYVRSVTHTIDRTSYKQQFSISRDGIGSTLSSVSPP